MKRILSAADRLLACFINLHKQCEAVRERAMEVVSKYPYVHVNKRNVRIVK